MRSKTIYRALIRTSPISCNGCHETQQHQKIKEVRKVDPQDRYDHQIVRKQEHLAEGNDLTQEEKEKTKGKKEEPCVLSSRIGKKRYDEKHY